MVGNYWRNMSISKLKRKEFKGIANDLNKRQRKRIQFNTLWSRFQGEKWVALQKKQKGRNLTTTMGIFTQVIDFLSLIAV